MPEGRASGWNEILIEGKTDIWVFILTNRDKSIASFLPRVALPSAHQLPVASSVVSFHAWSIVPCR